jgi:hypothetical protein
MGSPLFNLAGVWSVQKARGRNLDGEWVDEQVIGGTTVFTPDGKICAFIKTSEYTIGLSGEYTFDGKTFRTSKAATNSEFDTPVIEREFTWIEPNLVRVDAVDEVTGLPYEIILRKTNDVI